MPSDASNSPAALADPGIGDVVEILANRWTVVVVTALERGSTRFGGLRSATGMSAQLLSKTLRRLEENGLVARTAYAEIPPRVEYELTPLGGTLCPIVRAINSWAADHRDDVDAARAGEADATEPATR
ncbi:helix-turn-helix domain-containing protein [Microbacter sp. GSS18]|nr:helix-turn-helix domain-containing protein [Microbacter sp. GSS18]